MFTFLEILRMEGEEDIIVAKLQKLEGESRTMLSDLGAAAFPRDSGRVIGREEL